MQETYENAPKFPPANWHNFNFSTTHHTHLDDWLDINANIWMIGWIITQIAESMESTKTFRKNLSINLTSNASEIGTEIQYKNSRIADKPIITENPKKR